MFNLNLENKVVLITGASGGGVGTYTGRLFLSLGAIVYFNGKNQEKLESIIESLPEELKINARLVVADISNELEVKQMIETIYLKDNKIDILINNAANGGPGKKVYEVNSYEWEKEIFTTLYGSFLCSKYTSEYMIKQKYGKIIFISSNAAFRGTWGRNVGYASAKAGILGLCKQMALELAAYNINVNTIVPSQIDSPRIRKGGRKNDETLALHRKNIPLGRIGKPEDVANAIVFLASDVSSYITGQELFIDGGGMLAPSTTKSRS
ncbi:SDR family NAD(P)-dependent oxidoreductase [Bacillus thuringiensis]|uniref:SDR family NAD(P)-dependent oxidoreductase n=3 Tax=Bacillus thuringiensis TaxID=1428 RepID=UPI001298777C|nr:SDR family NAD(P)-dependent oxidoreductase [Bacillus thuringiensis]MED3347306.1 SDR family NAD(P)-dependent oxidoreductase [Bacillus thuringiensis]HDX9692281.1 SDR family oxidoreductase [Bacillus thuringiensis]